MPGSMPATSQLEWLISMTAMIVLFWSRATRDLLKSFGWGIAGTPSIRSATKLPFLAARPIASLSVPLWMQSYLSPGGALGPAGKAVAGLRDLATDPDYRNARALYLSAPKRRNSRVVALTCAIYLATSWSPQSS